MSNFVRATVVAWLAFAPAQASTIIGNPIVKIVLDSGPPVEVLGLRGLACPGSEYDGIDQTLSTSGYVTGALSEDLWCGLEIDVRWTAQGGVDTVPVDGVDALQTDPTAATVTLRLDPTDASATLEI